MFRVNQTEWINPRLKGVEHVRIIPCQDQKEEDCFYVDITTKDGNTYSSEYFDTFDDTEKYVQSLIDEIISL